MQPQEFLAPIALLFWIAGGFAQQKFDTHIANPSFPPKTGPRVVIDATHFNFAEQTDAFVDVLQNDGFRVSSQTTHWTSSSLKQTNVLVVMGPLAVDRSTFVSNEDYWWSDYGRESAFRSAEVLAVVRWVRAGGSLLLVLDHAPHASAARMLLQALGVDVRDSMTWDGNRRPPDYVYGSEPIWQCNCVSYILFSRDYASLGAHPILEGRNASERVNRVTTYGGSSLVGPVGSTPLLLLSAEAFDFWKDPLERGGAEHRVPAAGRAQGVAFPLDKGRVVVVSEFSVFIAAWGSDGDPDGKIGEGMAYAGADDRQFVLNTIRWLGRVIPEASAQAADPLVGTWKLSLSKSKFGPDPGPKSATIQVEEDGDMLRVRVASIDSEGNPTDFSYSVKKDGKEYQVTVTGVPNAGTTIWRHIDERTTDMIAMQNERELSRKRVVVSPDGRTQTATMSATDSKGQKYSVVTIWEKQ